MRAKVTNVRTNTGENSPDRLGQGQTVRVGGAPAESRPGLVLTVVAGPSSGHVHRATQPEVTLGSIAGNALVLNDTTVSRNHAVIETTSRGFRVRDLGSTNGTKIEGLRVLDAFVPSGTVLELGKSRVRLTDPGEALAVPLFEGGRLGPLLGESVAMRRVFWLISQVARTDVSVLLQGETGTGKDLVAETLHQASSRAAKPFVVVDCGAVSESLIESELFGHERGAFTGATGRRVGAIEAADGGTVFFDEIGELPLALQPKLLRVLERKAVRSVGANETKAFDVRFIAATHRDLRAEVNRGTFREDLFFRLSVAPIRLPALRDRREDLPMLAKHFWGRAGGKGPLPADLERALSASDWPGNLRELRNVVERFVAFGGDLLEPSAAATAPSAPTDAGPPTADTFKVAKAKVVEQFERHYLQALMTECQNNASEAARRADVDRVHLLKLLRRYGLR